MVNQSIDIRPIAGALGAEILGVDLSCSLSNQIRAAIFQAFLDHQMVCFREQDLDAARQVEIAAILGNPIAYPYLAGVEGVAEAHELVKTPDDVVNFGGVWHSDTAYKPKPDMGTVLYACEVPDAGGDTLYANAQLAYETLSDGMKQMIAGLVGVNDSEALYPGGRASRIGHLSEMKGAYNDGSEPMQSEHPIVRTHPDTGRKSLFVSIAHTLHFKNMTAEESKPLIHYLANHIVKPEFTCRLRWQTGTIAMWDNRCTQHFAVNDYSGQYRRMRRVTIEGDKPA
ncbi:MAG: taurine dioxygenase [Rhodospirillaceae bacterium]|jgi:taurine dioxygenase|nr:taurine dioxygenase [Rhodospirillaceae bacterium]